VGGEIKKNSEKNTRKEKEDRPKEALAMFLQRRGLSKGARKANPKAVQEKKNRKKKPGGRPKSH